MEIEKSYCKGTQDILPDKNKLSEAHAERTGLQGLTAKVIANTRVDVELYCPVAFCEFFANDGCSFGPVHTVYVPFHWHLFNALFHLNNILLHLKFYAILCTLCLEAITFGELFGSMILSFEPIDIRFQQIDIELQQISKELLIDQWI